VRDIPGLESVIDHVVVYSQEIVASRWKIWNGYIALGCGLIGQSHPDELQLDELMQVGVAHHPE